MKLMEVCEKRNKHGYLIFNQDDCWYIKIAENNVLGPYASFKKAQTYTETLALLAEIKDVA